MISTQATTTARSRAPSSPPWRRASSRGAGAAAARGARGPDSRSARLRRSRPRRTPTLTRRRPTRSTRTSIPTTTSRCGTRSRPRARASAQIKIHDAFRRRDSPVRLPSPSTPSTRLAGSRRQTQGAAGAAAEAAPQDQGRARRAGALGVRTRPARQDQAEQQVPRVGRALVPALTQRLAATSTLGRWRRHDHDAAVTPSS